MKLQGWRDKISNPAQLGGIETSVLDNGAGRGARIAWVNTGAGLRYKVVIDRAMDIAETFFQEHSLVWLSHAGVTSPEPFSHRGLDWLRTFGGGLLTTCGLSHVGPPEKDEHGERGLHGLISNIPGEIESIVQPDPLQGRMEMSITGKVRQTQIFGPALEMRRTISSTLGVASISIHDEVVNLGNVSTPHMLLYHLNFGWPLMDEGTDILWRGNWKASGGNPENVIFREGNNYRKAPAPSHEAAGEEVAFIDIEADNKGWCTCGVHNPAIGIALGIRFKKSQLPWLTNWQHWGKNEYVNGLEPGTHPPIGQGEARKQGTLIQLEPGEKRNYEVKLEVFHDRKSIQEFISNHKF